MRLISNEEVLQVSGGGLWDEFCAWASGMFAGGGCTPGFQQTGPNSSVTTSCGAGGSSQITVQSPGYIQTTSVTPGTGGSLKIGYGLAAADAAAQGMATQVITTTINGQTTTTVNGVKQ